MGKQIKIREIKWDTSALRAFISILDWIKQDSPTNAKRVKTRVTNLIKAIPSNPEMYREDENNRVNILYLDKWHEDYY